MKYILTESQFKVLMEVGRTSGNYHTQPIYSLFEYFNNKLSRKDKVESFMKYYKKFIGMKIRFLDSDIFDFFKTDFSNGIFPDEYISKDALSGFAYYISKKYFELKQGVELEYIIEKDGNERIYFFFDPQFKILVGEITTIENNSLPGKTYKVGSSAADEDLIGKGYGTQMYLSVIDNVDYLLSDTTLFTGAYRMWKHILPKYVNVWGAINEAVITKYSKIIPGKTKDVRKYDYFVASKHNQLESI